MRVICELENKLQIVLKVLEVHLCKALRVLAIALKRCLSFILLVISNLLQKRTLACNIAFIRIRSLLTRATYQSEINPEL